MSASFLERGKQPRWQKVLVVVVLQDKVALITSHQAKHTGEQENVHSGLQHPLTEWISAQLAIGFLISISISSQYEGNYFLVVQLHQ